MRETIALSITMKILCHCVSAKCSAIRGDMYFLMNYNVQRRKRLQG